MSIPDLLKNRAVLADALRGLKKGTSHYYVPGLWSAGSGARRAVKKVDPADFYLTAADRILDHPAVPIVRNHGGQWTRAAVIYNMFVRTTCAFDHNRNGKLDLPLNEEGWRETGTFLKAMALLPYVRSLGANTVHLLPITAIGSDGNKGTLGSPYAIRNPNELDVNLSEPKLGLGAEEEFRMFVDSAHHLGIRVVVEFVFRTSSKDGDWVKEHPDWYYWIKASVRDREAGSADEHRYGSPIFTKEELKQILSKVDAGDFTDLHPPHKEYREMFTLPPQSVQMTSGKYIGTLPDGSTARIPGAFADWPPDDSQPPWGDVTYLKMYSHPEFNYIAYNTLRMYDTRLAAKENVNAPLWEKIAEIIPHYQHAFRIDGVMIDMGHALPMELKQDMIRRARSIDPDFAFWDENFSVTKKSLEEGYNAVIGYQWSDQHNPEKFKQLLNRFTGEGYPVPFFATPESHNTPRAAARPGGIRYSTYAWIIGNFIPAIPFIHSGFELGEKYPINTGLDFSAADLKKLPSAKLPLFSEYAYDWTSRSEITDLIRKVAALRRRYQATIVNTDPSSLKMLEARPDGAIVFQRLSSSGGPSLLVAANSNMKKPIKCRFALEIGRKKPTPLIGRTALQSGKGGEAKIELRAGQVEVFEI